MGKMHGLAVFLIVFEGIITQCEVGATGSSRLRTIENSSGIRNLPSLSKKLIGNILGRTDLSTIQNGVQGVSVHPSDINMSELLKNRIVKITPHAFFGRTGEYREFGEIFIEFGIYPSYATFFEKFGEQVKKIKIVSSRRREDLPHDANLLYSIERFAKNLEEIRVIVQNDDGIWARLFLSRAGNEIIFPNVKTIHYFVPYNQLKFNVIFPSLESVKLGGTIKDANCLADVTTLKEFELQNYLIPEDELIPIFANNKNMKKIGLSSPNRLATMESIVENFKELVSLRLYDPGRNFLFRPNDQQLYNLPSVHHFHLKYSPTEDLVGKLSFDMPNLKTFSFRGDQVDNRIVDYIKHFEKLESVEFYVGADGFQGCVEFIKENFQKPTWTLLGDEFDEIDRKYLKFERQP